MYGKFFWETPLAEILQDFVHKTIQVEGPLTQNNGARRTIESTDYKMFIDRPTCIPLNFLFMIWTILSISFGVIGLVRDCSLKRFMT
jgi:hypothetical protein